MNAKSTFGIHFVLKQGKIIDGTAPIYARITVDSNRCEISLKKRIHTTNWNTGQGMAKGKSIENARLNSYLEQIRSQLTGYYQELMIEKKKITPEAIRDKFYGIAYGFEPKMGNIKKLSYNRKIYHIVPQ